MKENSLSLIKVWLTINRFNKALEKFSEEDFGVIINNIKSLSDNLARISGSIDEQAIANLVKNFGEFLGDPKKIRLGFW
ncbi:hypothetical protein C2G38_2165149 [Gigaspora rosea]|uniref:Uncharacterized protein n=1 Tax=Gigaspora rosea TaxID=44941 RepID=A0A397VV32_9GLOM|nr:hypothetical protein C2G38_2165149 [Gigaspora rosea]